MTIMRSNRNRHPIIVSLIRHEPSDSLVLFDLGMCKDWRSYVQLPGDDKDKADRLEETYKPEVIEDVDEVLRKMGVSPNDIKFIVFSRTFSPQLQTMRIDDLNACRPSL